MFVHFSSVKFNLKHKQKQEENTRLKNIYQFGTLNLNRLDLPIILATSMGLPHAIAAYCVCARAFQWFILQRLHQIDWHSIHLIYCRIVHIFLCVNIINKRNNTGTQVTSTMNASECACTVFSTNMCIWCVECSCKTHLISHFTFRICLPGAIVCCY